jgi:hypothetical protein
MCAAYFGWDDGDGGTDDFAGVHMVTGAMLLAVLAFKNAVTPWLRSLGRFLPRSALWCSSRSRSRGSPPPLLSLWVGRVLTQSHARQMVGSVVATVAIVLLTITLVTARLGPDGERREEREEGEDGDNSGRGRGRPGVEFATTRAPTIHLATVRSHGAGISEGAPLLPRGR